MQPGKSTRLAAGACLGPYEIVPLIGAGGMGEVYSARDTRLDRLVAIKILPAQLAATPDLRQRFEREARVISSLHHPNICTLHDIGSDAGIDYVVMEHLDGETLAARLARGPIPVADCVSLAVQIAGALDAAHRNGVVHRDLKPANIMLTRTGVKLLDFGLARMVTLRGGEGSTVTAGITEPGMVLGTLQYMSPEQLEGKDADARTDLFALGAVVYEMIAGRTAFAGGSPASLISATMSTHPAELVSLVPSVPPALAHLVHACLIKDPEARWQSAHDLKLELEAAGTAVSSQQTSSRALFSRVAFVAIIALMLLAGMLLFGGYFHRAPVSVSVTRSSLLPPAGEFFERGNFALAPDGSRLAFVAVDPSGVNRLWIRTLATATPQSMNGTEGAMLPFWAPDSRRVGFFAAAKLKTIDVETGAVRVLSEASFGRFGASWNSDGVTVFAPALGTLSRISDTGGMPVQVTTAPQGSGQRHAWPFLLPDGKHFLYTVRGDGAGLSNNGTYVGAIDGSPAKLVSSEFGGNVAYADGHLLYCRDRSLRARPFDLGRLQITGSEIAILDQEMEEDHVFSHWDFSVSNNGVLVFQSVADFKSRLIWFDEAGKELGQVADASYSDPRLSPDGRFLAVVSDDAGNGKFVVRVHDLRRGVTNRLTEGDNDESPVWSSAGDKIAYAAFDGKTHTIKVVPVDRSTPPQVLIKRSGFLRHLDWSADGRLAFSDFSSGLPVVMMMYAGSQDTVANVSPGRAGESRISPDGKWIAYVAQGIVVQPLSGPGGRIEISGSDGAQPVWARDGKRLFYIAPDRKLMAVTFSPERREVSTRQALFQTRIVGARFVATQYDVAGEGRFLINSIPVNAPAPPTLISGWNVNLKN